MSLSKPHLLWSTAGSSPYQVSMATIQAIMISGRYRTELLVSNWSPDNNGSCQAPSCIGAGHPEDLQHILADCGSLTKTRDTLQSFTRNYCQQLHPLQPIVQAYCSTSNSVNFCPFLLDCSVLPEPIKAAQVYGPEMMFLLFRVTRSWCYCLHKARLQQLGRWHKF